jgi:hypothetical protein
MLPQVLERCIRRGEYATLAPDVQARFRHVVMSLVVGAGRELLARGESYIVNRITVVLGLLIQADYPKKWPTAFDELLPALEEGPDLVDIFLRVLVVIDQEVRCWVVTGQRGAFNLCVV